MIKGLNLISATPRKSGRISVLLEADNTRDNLRALTELYDEPLALGKEAPNKIEDRFDLLLEVRGMCQRTQDLITRSLEPLPAPAIGIVEAGLTAADALDAEMFVPPGPYAKEFLTAADADEVEVDLVAPANEFYGEGKDDDNS